MEPLGEDELLCIFNKISSYNFEDRRSFAQVSKQFMKVACVGLYQLYCCFPDLLFDILPSSPNMRYFQCFKPLSNSHLKLLAQSCPKLRELILGINYLSDPREFGFDFDFEFDFDDDGLCAVGNSCSHLRKVNLNMRSHIGDAGIVSLVTSCKDLTQLHMKGCIRVTDESLKAIGESGIRNLNLGGCDRISDNGLIHLKQMVGLTQLNLSKCGDHVTESVIVALISQLTNIEMLDLSWLINVTDISLLAIGSKCLKLTYIYLTGCDAVTVEGLRAFSGHQTLKSLMLFSCYNFCWEDVESVALTCLRLEYLGLMKRIKTPMPEFDFDYLRIGRNYCGIGWDEPNNVPLF